MLLRSINQVLNKFEELFVSTAIIITAFFLFINVVTRNLGYSMKWVEEFTRYIIVWITFIGGAICVRNYTHVGIDALISNLAEKPKWLVEIIIYVIGMLFSMTMTVLGFQLMIKVMSLQQLTPAMMIPMWIPYAGIPIGFGLMSIRYFQVALDTLRKTNRQLDKGGEL